MYDLRLLRVFFNHGKQWLPYYTLTQTELVFLWAIVLHFKEADHDFKPSLPDTSPKRRGSSPHSCSHRLPCPSSGRTATRAIPWAVPSLPSPLLLLNSLVCRYSGSPPQIVWKHSISAFAPRFSIPCKSCSAHGCTLRSFRDLSNRLASFVSCFVSGSRHCSCIPTSRISAYSTVLHSKQQLLCFGTPNADKSSTRTPSQQSSGMHRSAAEYDIAAEPFLYVAKISRPCGSPSTKATTRRRGY